MFCARSQDCSLVSQTILSSFLRQDMGVCSRLCLVNKGKWTINSILHAMRLTMVRSFWMLKEIIYLYCRFPVSLLRHWVRHGILSGRLAKVKSEKGVKSREVLIYSSTEVFRVGRQSYLTPGWDGAFKIADVLISSSLPNSWEGAQISNVSRELLTRLHSAEGDRNTPEATHSISFSFEYLSIWEFVVR